MYLCGCDAFSLKAFIVPLSVSRMGQKGYFGYLKNTLKFQGEEVDPEDCPWAKWEIDLLGTYGAFIRQTMMDDLSISGLTLGRKLGYHVASRFRPDITTLYMDGDAPDQKSKAHTQRAEGRLKALREIDTLLEKMRSKSEAGKWTPKTTIHAISKKLAAIFRMDPQYKADFIKGLEEAKCNVVVCRGEADTAVAEAIGENPVVVVDDVSYTRVAVSSDSDLLGYRAVSLVLRKLSGAAGSGFRLYRKERLLDVLGLSTIQQLETLAIISDNDYDGNLRGYGWATNVKYIKETPTSRVNHTLDLLDHYIQRVNSDKTEQDHITRSAFASSIEVFLDLSPTYRNEQIQSTAYLDFTDRLQKFEELKSLRDKFKETKDNPPLPATQLEFYTARYSEPNRYRPYFRSKERLLTSPNRTRNINTTQVTRFTEPRKGPRTKKRKQKNQKQESKKKKAKKVTRGFGILKKKEEDPGQRRNLRPATNQDHRLRSKYVTKSAKVGSLHANIKRTINSGNSSNETEAVCDTIAKAAHQVDEMCAVMYEVIALDIDRIFEGKVGTDTPPPATTHPSSTTASSSSSQPPQEVQTFSPSPLSASSQPPPGTSALSMVLPSTSSSSQPPLDPAAMSLTSSSAPSSPTALAKGTVPAAVVTSPPVQLNAEEKADLLDLTSDGPTFYRQLATLLLKGSLGPGSKFERLKKAPPRRQSTRNQKTPSASDAQEEILGSTYHQQQHADIEVPHALRAYNRYLEVLPTFVPFHQRPDAITFQPSVSHLAVDRVQLSIRQKYIGSQFSGEDGLPIKKPMDAVPIEWVFRMNSASHPFTDYVKSGWTAGYQLFSEESVTYILYQNKATQPTLLRVLGCLNLTECLAKVLGTKGLLIQRLLYPVGKYFPRRDRPSGYHSKLALQSEHHGGDDGDDGDDGNDGDDGSDGSRRRKLLVRPVIRTNGLVLHLLAYDLMEERKKHKKETIKTASDSGLDGLEGDDDDDDFVLSAPFLDQQESLSSLPTASSSSRPPLFAASSSASSTVPSSSTPPAHSASSAYNPESINFSRSSKNLVNVELKFADPEECPDYEVAQVAGIDLGERITMCATRIGPKDGTRTVDNEGERETVNVRRNFLYKPTTMFRMERQRKLQETGLDVVQSRIPELKLGGVRAYLDYVELHRQDLYQFYHGPWYMKRAWDAAKAQDAAYDYAIKAVMGLVGASEGRKHIGDGPPPIFAIGLGSFDTRTGLSTKHSKLEKLFIKKTSLQLSSSIVSANDQPCTQKLQPTKSCCPKHSHISSPPPEQG
ncbi:MAG: hypothetical protein J3R72DRAFT_422603 [Linnemannia gamsii]|nr:MAG: hypothetical protein J3R72DRAFT_422603 [Linnemannia gamsii]